MVMPEPKCVQWAHEWQRVSGEKRAGMTRAEEAAHWEAVYQQLVRTHAESKKRLQAAGDLPSKREVAPMPEPKCVQWKREWQRAARARAAGESRAKESR